MSWVKLDDKFPDHPKIEQAGERAAWLFVCGLCYCAEHLTDGFIPASKAARLTEASKARIDALLKVGLWEKVEGGYQVPGYLEYQPSADKVKAERTKAAERMANGRASSGEVRANNQRSSPVPSPSPPSTSSSSSLTSVRGDDGRISEAAKILAGRDLDRVQVDKGRRSDPQAWLVTATQRRWERHVEDAERILKAKPNLTAEQLAHILEPNADETPTCADCGGRFALGSGWMHLAGCSELEAKESA